MHPTHHGIWNYDFSGSRAPALEPIEGMEALLNVLGEVQAERFISLVMRETFDYTIWQRKLWSDKTVEEISHQAMLSRNQSSIK